MTSLTLVQGVNGLIYSFMNLFACLVIRLQVLGLLF